MSGSQKSPNKSKQKKAEKAAWETAFTDTEKKTLIAFQQDLHENPELAFEEVETSKKATELLKTLKPESIEYCAKTGVLATFKGTDANAKEFVVIRGDMDALPIQENTGLPYSSKRKGLMHACGHDVHTTWAIAAAMLLKKSPPPFPYAVLLQPAEEVTLGAKAVLKSGVLNNATRIFGAHVDCQFPIGDVICQPGCIAASSDMMQIDIVGKSAHGARPQEGRDPFPALAALINALNTISSRFVHPDEAVVVSLGCIEGGKTHNIIPDVLRLKGTIRTVNPDTRRFVHQMIKKMGTGIAQSFDCTITIDIVHGTPPVMNDPDVVSAIRPSLENIFGKNAVKTLPKANLASEDFAYYLEKIPGAFLRIGARKKSTPPIPAHNDAFFVEQTTIFSGASALAACVKAD